MAPRTVDDLFHILLALTFKTDHGVPAYNGPCQKHLLFHGFTTSQSFLEVGNCTALSLFFGDKKIYLLMKDTVVRLPSI